MYNDSDSKPILTKCTFSGNLADNGGGIYSFENNPELIDCVFTSNSANPEGGGIAFIDCYHITLTRCEFSANEAEAGGGIYLKRSYVTTNLTMTGCTFTGNFALFSGGGVNCSSALENGTLNGMLTNCLFTGNQATEGTAIKCGVVKQWKIMNCTIAHNKAIFYGNGNVVDIVSSNFLEDVVLSASNCIVWGNQIGQKPQSPVDDIFQNIHQLNWTYSLIEGGQSGEGNIDVDPDFVNPGYWVLNNNPVDPDDDIWVDGDYHLKSQAGRWDPNSGNWVYDLVNSPCIDAGDPNTPVGDEPEPNGGIINMGAYGGTEEASKSKDDTTSLSIAYVYYDDLTAAQSFQLLLETNNCPTTLIKTVDWTGASSAVYSNLYMPSYPSGIIEANDVTETSLDSYDLIIVADDAFQVYASKDPNFLSKRIAAIEDSGRPIISLGVGGYDFFGLLGLPIGNPFGGHGSKNSIKVVDPNSSIFSTPYSIEIPEDRVLQLYADTNSIGIYFWPTVPETITVFGNEIDDAGYYPLVMEQNRYFLWGFTESPDKMTETGKKLFINTVIWMANAGRQNEN